MTTMDLSTTYLGLKLKNPLVAGAGPLSRDLDTLRHMEDAGISAAVLDSLFEEQIQHDAGELDHFLTQGGESFAEAVSYFPATSEFKKGPEEYLEYIAKAKAKVSMPVIASLNGVSAGGWMDYAKLMQEAGADAIELNIYYVPADPNLTAGQIEAMYVEAVKAVKAAVTVPVAIKLSPYFTNMAYTARQLSDAGADGLVLFNRFYQPDIDLDSLEVVPNLVLSSPSEMRLPLRWIAILYGHVKADLAGSSGIHRAEDVLKTIMAGASSVQVCSTLIVHGIKRASEILKGVEGWMEEHDYESVAQMKGSLSQQNCPEPAAFERANYMKVLQSYK
jgi:dihydroorotate dehydrogenase (fumarate)